MRFNFLIISVNFDHQVREPQTSLRSPILDIPYVKNAKLTEKFKVKVVLNPCSLLFSGITENNPGDNHPEIHNDFNPECPSQDFSDFFSRLLGQTKLKFPTDF